MVSKSSTTILAQKGLLLNVTSALALLWSLTASDILTFVIPNTFFGTLGALSGPILTTSSSPSLLSIISRFPLVVLFNWLNLLIFDLANQRESGTEDAINKPSRPIPSGRMTAVQMRRMLLVAIPVVLVVGFELGVWEETLGIMCLTWMYNDLGGSSESFVSRNVIIACAYGVYNLGSLRVACGPGTAISERGVHWIVCVSGMILSTMHIQDLKDQRGDRKTGRSTIPLVFGDGVARWSVAVPVLVWSVLCPVYMNVGMVGFVVPCCLGIVTAGRVLRLKRPEDDQISWECWALWSISLYILPLVKYHEA